jgi:4-fold beta flower protein
MRGLIDRKGEQFAYFEGATLYTLEGEPTGRIEGEFIVDRAGNPIWRVVGDAVYALDGSETVGYIGSEISDDYSR